MSMFSIASSKRHVGIGDGGLEGVEVHRHQVEAVEPVLAELAHVLVAVGAGEQPGVHRGVERLDPAVEDLREAGDLVDGSHGHSLVAKYRRGAASGDDLPAEAHQGRREGNDATLVTDREEGSGHVLGTPRRRGRQLKANGTG